MKKLLIGLVSLAFVGSAFAGKHMVRFYDFNDGGMSDSVDFSMDTSDAEDAEVSDRNIAINYAYAINNVWQIGGTYKSDSNTVDGDDSGSSSTMGLSVYYNRGESLDNTCYFAFHYDITDYTAEDDSTEGNKDTAMVLEYGHRWAVGSAWGFNLTYSPSVSYTMNTRTWGDDTPQGVAETDDLATTALAFNWIKFDVLF